MSILEIQYGGTSASTVYDARRNLGLSIGDDVQQYSFDLSAIAALSGSGYLKKISPGIWTFDSLDSQNLSFYGDVTGSGIGSIELTLADSGVIPNTYSKVTVNSKGIVTSGSSLLESDLPSVSWSKIISTPTTLSGYGITDAQPLSSVLTSISNLSLSKNQFIYVSESNTLAATTVTPLARILLSSDNVEEMRANLELVVGTDVQQYSFDLSAIAALSGSGYLKRTSSNTWTIDNSLDNLESILSNTGLSDFLNQFITPYVPTEPTNLVTKSYVDDNFVSNITGISPVTITGTTNPIISVDLATQSTPGLLSSTDKTKLDNLDFYIYVHPNHTGDVTSIGDGVQTISNNAVTLAKIQDIPSGTLIGRHSTLTGDPELITISTLESMLSLGSAAYTNSTDYTPYSHIGTGGTSHAVATVLESGFMSSVDKHKLDNIENYANRYIHPSTDGYLHVPATGTTNAGKVLTAGDTAGSLTWETVVSNISSILPIVISVDGSKSVISITEVTSTSAGSMIPEDKIKLDASTSSNTPYTLVERDASGNFSAGTITATLNGNAATVTNGVYTVGDQTIAGVKTFSSTIVGSISGNAATSTNATNHIADTSGAVHGATNVNTANMIVRRDASGNFSAGTITASLSGNASTVTNGVYTVGDQTIAGVKTFSSTISGSINGNAATVTNGVYTVGDQTIAGVKTFSSTIVGSISGNAATSTNATNHIADVTGTVHGATNVNTANMIVRRDASGNFSAGTITATLNGNAATVTNGVYTVGDQTIAGVKTFSSTIVGSISGNAATSTNATNHIGTGGTSHATATVLESGFMSSTDKAKLDTVESYANNYVHPSTDGYLHVPATGTTNAGKVLTAGDTAGSLSWSIPISSASIVTVHQPAHNFIVGTVIKLTSVDNVYERAQGNSLENAEVAGYVTEVVDADNFVYTISGIITAGVPVATSNTVFFLDPLTPGAITSTEPTTVGQISKPILIVVESGVKAILLQMRGYQIDLTYDKVSSMTIVTVHQPAHNFIVGTVIKLTSVDNVYEKAQGNSLENAEVAGYVTEVIDADNFVYTISGIITAGVPVATSNTVFFLDPLTPGAITSTEPTTVGQVSKPILIVVESGVKAILLQMRGYQITTVGQVRLLSYADATLSGTPKVFVVYDIYNTPYYFKGYPTMV